MKDWKDTKRPKYRKMGRRSRYLTRGALILVFLLLLPVGFSYVRALTAPGNANLAMRSVEWVRNEHGGALVAAAENLWYTTHQPPKGGPPLHQLPKRAPSVAGSTTSASPAPTPSASAPSALRPSNSTASGTSGKRPRARRGLPAPKNIRPLIRPALAKEGVWTPAGRSVGGRFPILETTLRPSPSYPTVVAGLTWIDTPLVRLVLVPGLTQPVPNAGAGEVPFSLRKGLLATFNSGFKNKDGHGGFIANGRTYVSPKSGLGTIAIYKSGKVKIGSWGRGIPPSSNITYLRQNLPLIVDHGRPNPATDNSYLWGATVGNAIRVWRSGIGIDSHGGLIYAAGNGVTTRELADLLVRAGAVRGMQLDINSYWVNLFTYGAPGGGSPSKLLPSMTRPKNRYLSPDERDFFAVLAANTKKS